MYITFENVSSLGLGMANPKTTIVVLVDNTYTRLLLTSYYITLLTFTTIIQYTLIRNFFSKFKIPGIKEFFNG